MTFDEKVQAANKLLFETQQVIATTLGLQLEAFNNWNPITPKHGIMEPGIHFIDIPGWVPPPPPEVVKPDLIKDEIMPVKVNGKTRQMPEEFKEH